MVDIKQIYNEDPNLKKEDIQTLREWAKKQPHLPEPTELQLICFLHSCYYRLEEAKVTIDNFFSARTMSPELFKFPTIEQIKQSLSVALVAILPERTPEGFVVFLSRFLDCNPENYNFNHITNIADLIMSLHYHQYGPNNGVVCIMDSKGLSFGHLAKFSLTGMKKHAIYVQEGAPLRIKGIHYLNVSSLTDKILSLAKPFLKKELIDLLHFHPNDESLSKYIPTRILPKEYGGEAPSVHTLRDQNEKLILENIDFFKFQDSQTVDESKRIGKSKIINDVFGIDGSFKKLDLD